MSGVVFPALVGAGMMAVTFASQGYRGFVKNGSPTTEYNKRLVRRLYKKVWGDTDQTKVRAHYHRPLPAPSTRT